MIPTLRSHYRIGKNCYKTIFVEQNWILHVKFLRRYWFVSGDVNTRPSFTMFMWRQDLFVGPFVQRIRDALGAEGHDFHYTGEFFEEVFAFQKFYTTFNYVFLRLQVNKPPSNSGGQFNCLCNLVWVAEGRRSKFIKVEHILELN